jgi:hypothetical protein
MSVADQEMSVVKWEISGATKREMSVAEWKVSVASWKM